MTGLWPWLAVAGVGALHGLNPATGWAFVAARGARAGGRVNAWRALAPITLGHAASVALIAALATLGLVAQRGVLPWLAGGLAVFVAAVHVSGHLPQRLHAAAGQAGLTLWSFTMGLAHGAGMMLVPALIPLCLSASPAREITASGSMLLALAAVAVHMAAMLAVTAAMAAAACVGWGRVGRWTSARRGGLAWGLETTRAVLRPTRFVVAKQSSGTRLLSYELECRSATIPRERSTPSAATISVNSSPCGAPEARELQSILR